MMLKSEKGFTLLEVLIAIALFSIVMGALYSTFFLSHKAVDALDDSLVKLQESRTVIDTLKRELESAVYEERKTYTIFKIDDRDFYGKQASQVVFTAFSPLLPGLARVEYTVDEVDGKLVLRKKIFSAYAKTAETESIELMDDVESFSIEVRDQDKWVKTWDGALTKKMPDEIRISLQIVTKKSEDQENPSPPYVISEVALPKYMKSL